MPRYVHQRDEFRCGPIAILNALKWAGYRVTAELIPDLCREVSCAAPFGTKKSNLTRGLRTRGKGIFFTQLDLRPSLQKIERTLQKGKAVILGYWYHTDDPENKNYQTGHYVLITGVSPSGSTFSVANYIDIDDTQRTRISRSRLQNDLQVLKVAVERWYPDVWYLRKRQPKARR